MTTSSATPQAGPTPAGPGGSASGGQGGNGARLASIRPHLPREFVARLVEGIVVGSAAGTASIHAPLTGEVIVELPQSGPGDVRHAFQKARATQPAWAARPVGERAEVLRRLHDLLFDNEPHLLNLIQIETGKSRLSAYEELAGASAALRHYAAAAAGYLKPRRKPGFYPMLTKVAEVRHPKGVVGLITPWNYPLAIVIMDIAPALVAGNAVVHKPDNATALTALYTRQFAIRAGLPEDVWQIVTGEGPITGPAVVDHADYVAFTGSTRTGRQVAQQAAGRLVGCSLELGGKNAMIVFDDADVEKAVQGALRGCFSSAGQLCVSIERLYVHYSLHDQFVERFVTEAKALRLGGGLDYSAEIGSLASTKQLETVTLHVEDARAKGAKVLSGGRRRPDVGSLFYEPTILSGVTPSMTVYAEETFGPVVSIYGFRNEAEVIDAANDTPYGLNASVWSRDSKRAREIALRMHTGMVNINEAYGAAFGSVGAAIGGMGDSGVGRRNGAEGIWRYTELQTVAQQTMLPTAPWFGMGPERFTKLISVLLRTLKRLRLK
ncbi:MAG TPA: succinic semialdehyde dehydrogenase [Actinocrinis sp.]|uniref:succinic semialdehyde dehydrogenase n=1 Tax=Actinocrinis sp. TaxID=1920516 RepID=UPI002DDD21CB|nr:succinic semialdehyde dehydrogenase [Actinocrinis sp.]HEV2346483.1 succinic semialdehyde dehydrogenase [Actinocrinis sp.]